MKTFALFLTIPLMMLGDSMAQPQEGGKKKLLEAAIQVAPPSKDVPKELQVKPEDKIVALGDSITAGGGYLRYAEQVLASFPELKSTKIVNAGISGHKAENMIARFDKDVLGRKPTIVTINVGINDVWHRVGKPHDDAVLKAYRDNVIKMVDKAQEAGVRVILLAPTVIQEDVASEGNKRLPLYVKTMQDIALEKKCQFVDLHGMFLHALKSKPADVKGNWITSDGVHMNSLGNGVMALGVLRALGVQDEKTGAVEAAVAGKKGAK